MREHRFSCRTVSPGKVCAEVIRSGEEILFYHTDFASGVITEKGHALEGRSIRGRIVVFPGGKGSSVVQMDGLYNLEQGGAVPAGLITEFLDTVLVSAAIIMKIPMVWKVDPAFYDCVADGDRVLLDADHGEIRILSKM